MHLYPPWGGRTSWCFGEFNSSIYFRNKIAEYLFASHLTTQSIFTTIFVNVGIMSLCCGFYIHFLGLPQCRAKPRVA